MAVYNPDTNRGGVPERHQLGQVDPNSRQYRRDNFVVDPWHKFSPEIEEHGGAVAPTIYVGRDESKWTDKSRRYFEENPNWKHSAFYREYLESMKPPEPKVVPQQQVTPAPSAPPPPPKVPDASIIPKPAPPEPVVSESGLNQIPQNNINQIPYQQPQYWSPPPQWSTGNQSYFARGVDSNQMRLQNRRQMGWGGTGSYFGRYGSRLKQSSLNV